VTPNNNDAASAIQAAVIKVTGVDLSVEGRLIQTIYDTYKESQALQPEEGNSRNPHTAPDQGSPLGSWSDCNQLRQKRFAALRRINSTKQNLCSQHRQENL
jgi:hypothetical protein